jgi:alpha-D-ribose 1-methylphosphonate 5-triphosphate synthase subunit PhnI
LPFASRRGDRPLIEMTVEKVAAQIADAVKKGPR